MRVALPLLLLVEGLQGFAFTPASVRSTPKAASRLGRETISRLSSDTTAPQELKTLDPAVEGVVVPTAAAAAAPPVLKGVVVPTAAAAAAPVLRPELDAWREYEFLRGEDFNLGTLQSYFAGKPQVIAGRLYNIFQTLRRTQAAWEAGASAGLTEGEKSDKFDPTKDIRDTGPAEGRGRDLCDAMASLGPISVKISQTLSQRPDIVGDEAATALKQLQTSNVPFDDTLAWAVKAPWGSDFSAFSPSLWPPPDDRIATYGP